MSRLFTIPQLHFFFASVVIAACLSTTLLAQLNPPNPTLQESYFVDSQDGSDSSRGIIDQPLKTLAKALSKLQSQTTIDAKIYLKPRSIPYTFNNISITGVEPSTITIQPYSSTTSSLEAPVVLVSGNTVFAHLNLSLNGILIQNDILNPNGLISLTSVNAIISDSQVKMKPWPLNISDYSALIGSVSSTVVFQSSTLNITYDSLCFSGTNSLLKFENTGIIYNSLIDLSNNNFELIGSQLEMNDIKLTTDYDGEPEPGRPENPEAAIFSLYFADFYVTNSLYSVSRQFPLKFISVTNFGMAIVDNFTIVDSTLSSSIFELQTDSHAQVLNANFSRITIENNTLASWNILHLKCSAIICFELSGKIKFGASDFTIKSNNQTVLTFRDEKFSIIQLYAASVELVSVSRISIFNNTIQSCFLDLAAETVDGMALEEIGVFNNTLSGGLLKLDTFSLKSIRLRKGSMDNLWNIRNINITQNVVNGNLIDLSSEEVDSTTLAMMFYSIANLSLVNNSFKQSERTSDQPNSVITSYNIGFKISNLSFWENALNVTSFVELTGEMATIVIANSSFVGSSNLTTTSLFYKNQMDFNRNPMVDPDNSRYVPNFGSFCLLGNTFRETWRLFDGSTGFSLNVANFFIHNNSYYSTLLEAQSFFGVSNIIPLVDSNKPMKILLSQGQNPKRIVDPYLQDLLLLNLFEKAIFENAQADENKTISCVFSFSGNELYNVGMISDSLLQISTSIPGTLLDVSNNILVGITSLRKSPNTDYSNIFDLSLSSHLYFGSNIMSNTWGKSTTDLRLVKIGEGSSDQSDVLIFNNTFEQNYFISFIDAAICSTLLLNISENKIKNCKFQGSPAVHLDFKLGASHVLFLQNSFETNIVFTYGLKQAGLIVFEAQESALVSVIFEENSIIKNSFASNGINPLSLAYKNSLFYFMNLNSGVTVKNSTFLLNTADTNIYFVVIFSPVVMIDSLNMTSQGSTLDVSVKRPGATAYISTQNLTVMNSVFKSNAAQIGAGFVLDSFFTSSIMSYLSAYQSEKTENSIDYLYLSVRNSTFKHNTVSTGGVIHIAYMSSIPLIGEISGCRFDVDLALTDPTIYMSSITVARLLLSDNEYNCSSTSPPQVLTGRLLYFTNLEGVPEQFDQSIRILNSRITLHHDIVQNGFLIEMFNVVPLILMQNLTFFHDRNPSHDDTNGLTIASIGYSTVSLNDVHFSKFSTQSPLIRLNKKAIVSMNATTFTNMTLSYSSVIQTSEEDMITVNITYCSFSNFKFPDLSFPSAITILRRSTNVYINNTNFTELQGSWGTAIKAQLSDQFLEFYGTIVVENSLFSMNSVGAIKHDGGILLVNHCKFIHNTNKANGGAISSQAPQMIMLTNNHFENNSVIFSGPSQTSFGGAVYIGLEDLDLEVWVSSNTFVSNSVIDRSGTLGRTSGGGGAIYIDLGAIPPADSALYKAIHKLPTLNHFSNNSAIYGPDFATNAVFTAFQSYNSTDKSVSHECLTSPCQFHVQAWTDIFRDSHLNVYFLDLYGQRLLPFYGEFLPSEYKMKLQITNQPQPVYDFNCSSWNCIINGNDVKIKGFANQPLNLTFEVFHPSYPSINFTIMTSMRECQLGEINDTSRLTCSPCEKGSYSMNKSDTTCSPCPDNAFCPGGYQVIPKKGYWKPNIYSTNIYLCNNSDVCDAMTYGERACAPGYKGPFCLACELENGYASSGTGCAKCPPFWQGMLILCSLQLLIFAIEIAYIWYFRKINKSMIVGNKFSKKSVDRVSRGGYMTIMMDYLQIITILKGYPLVVSGFLAALSHIGNPSQTLLYSSDCVFLQVGFSPENVFYAKLVSIVLLPFVKLFLCMIFGFVKKFAYTHFRFNDYIIVAIQCLVLVEQPSMLSALLSAINCQSIDPKAPDQSKVEYFLKENPEVTCYTNAYNSYRNIMALPMLVFWGICLPVILAAALIYNRNRLKTYSFATKFGIQYAIYRSKMYFWNLIQLLNKFILIFFAQSSFLPLNMLGLTLFLILIGYMLIIKQFQPYRSVDLQKTYIRSIYVFIFTIFAAVYGYEESQLDKVISSFIILLNAAFIIFIAIKLLHLFGYRWITRSLNNLFNKVFHNKDGNKNYFFDDSYHNLTDSVLHPDHHQHHHSGEEKDPHQVSESVPDDTSVLRSSVIVHRKTQDYAKLDG